MHATVTLRRWLLLPLLIGIATDPSASEPGRVASLVGSLVPFARSDRCAESYRQLAVSPPLQGTSDGGEGFPWRMLYGYCVVQSGSLSLHQDWVVAYLDATPQGDNAGGAGISAGTDLSVQWRKPRSAAVTPYFEAGGGIQYAAGTSFPAHGSRWMFTINAGAGLLFLLPSGHRLNTAIRYLHISNAGLWSGNAGYDALHILVGIRW